jgi:hypothetical protein
MEQTIELLAKGDIIVSENTLRQAGLRGVLQIVVHKGEVRILAKKQTDSENILDELAGCLGNESVSEYDFGLKIGGLYEIR